MRRGAAELVAGVLIFAFMTLHGGVVSNCFRLVEYSAECSHLECVLPDFAGVDLVVDKRGDTGWSVSIHHTRGTGYVAKVAPGERWLSYLDFTEQKMTVDYPVTNEFYCGYTWNAPKLVGGAGDFLGWVHLKVKDGMIALAGSAVEEIAGQRLPISATDPDLPLPDVLSWTDTETGITWHYTTNGVAASLGGGIMAYPAVDAKVVGGRVVVPERVGSLPVVAISEYAFYNCHSIDRLTIPAAVTNIAASAFSGSGVSELVCLGDRMSVEGGDFFGMPEKAKVVAQIGTKGWSGLLYWRGLELAVEDDEKREYTISTNGVRRTATSWLVEEVKEVRLVSRYADKGTSGWVRTDKTEWDCDVYRKELLQEPMTCEHLVVSNGQCRISYWDLDRIRSVRQEVCWKVNVELEEPDVFNDHLERGYDEQGNLTFEDHTLTKNDGVRKETLRGDYSNIGGILISVVTRCVSEGGVSEWSETTEYRDSDGQPTYRTKVSRTRPTGSEGVGHDLVYPYQSAFVTGVSGGAEEALASVDFNYMVPDYGKEPCQVSVDGYAAYFKPKAVCVGDGEWEVSLEIDIEAIDLPGSVASLGAQLGGVAEGSAKTITLTTKPGLWYGIETAETPVGPYKRGEMVLATGATVELPAPPAASNLFLRVAVSPKE